LVVSSWKAFAVCPPSNYFSIKTVQLRLFVGLFTVLNYALTGVALLMELKKILPFWSTAQILIASDFSERTFLPRLVYYFTRICAAKSEISPVLSRRSLILFLSSGNILLFDLTIVGGARKVKSAPGNSGRLANLCTNKGGRNSDFFQFTERRTNEFIFVKFAICCEIIFV
jgi:hypothetical protein